MWYGMPLPMVMSKNVSSFTHVYAVTKKEKAVLIQMQKQPLIMTTSLMT